MDQRAIYPLPVSVQQMEKWHAGIKLQYTPTEITSNPEILVFQY